MTCTLLCVLLPLFSPCGVIQEKFSTYGLAGHAGLVGSLLTASLALVTSRKFLASRLSCRLVTCFRPGLSLLLRFGPRTLKILKMGTLGTGIPEILFPGLLDHSLFSSLLLNYPPSFSAQSFSLSPFQKSQTFWLTAQQLGQTHLEFPKFCSDLTAKTTIPKTFLGLDHSSFSSILPLSPFPLLLGPKLSGLRKGGGKTRKS